MCFITHVDKSWQVSFFNWRMVLRSIRKVDLRREKHRRDVTSSSASRFCRGTFWLELHKHTSYQSWRRRWMPNVNHIFDLQSEPSRNHLFFLNQTNRFFRQLLEVLQLQKQPETGRLQTFLTLKTLQQNVHTYLSILFLISFSFDSNLSTAIIFTTVGMRAQTRSATAQQSPAKFCKFPVFVFCIWKDLKIP